MNLNFDNEDWQEAPSWQVNKILFREFLKSGVYKAEVTELPEGRPVRNVRSSMQTSLSRMDPYEYPIKVVQADGRLFLVRTDL